MARRRRGAALKGHGRADAERIGEAIGRPGIDPRAWVTLGRSDPSPDGRRYDPDVGWIVDVAAYGSAVHGTVLPCRVASAWPGIAGYGEIRPPGADEEIVVLLPGGDPDEDPIAIGVVANGDGGGPPETVAGRTVLAEGTTTLGGPLAATDCEFSKSPYSRVEEHEGERHMKAKFLTLEASTSIAGVKLGSQTARHAVPRADELILILVDLCTQLATLVGAGVAPVPVAPAPVLAMTGAPAFLAAIAKIIAELPTKVPSPGVVVD